MQTFQTTFGIPVEVDELVKVGSLTQLQELITSESIKDYIVVGGGSNLILNDKHKYKILQVDIKGIEILNVGNLDSLNDGESVLIKVGAGELWDEVVGFAVENDLQGIEALSAIPGTAGAAPVQNIGAYGSEVKDALEQVEVIDRETGEIKIFKNEDCNFSYRQSIFKNELKDRFIITHIILKLKKTRVALIPKYKEIKKHFENDFRELIPLTEIRRAITDIRWAKLPKPEQIPNVGSFFHNPILSKNELEELQKILPEVPVFEDESGKYKVPAGYLMDKAGLKGCTLGNVGTYEKHALVLVNYGWATFEDLENFIQFIQKTIKEKFSIELKIEPELVV